MKKGNIFVLIALVLLLAACQSSQQSLTPTKDESIDFDRNTATKMVEKKERMIVDAAPDADQKINADMLYPTVFHEGVTITSSTVHTVEYEETLRLTTLTVKEEYNGDDERLKGWNREYTFEPDENEEWQLQGFSGTMNFTGDDYKMDDLGLKL